MIETILDYNEFKVIHDTKKDKYIYSNGNESFEVFPIASLVYDISHEFLETENALANMFDSFCCGEHIDDEFIEYIWFDKI